MLPQVRRPRPHLHTFAWLQRATVPPPRYARGLQPVVCLQTSLPRPSIADPELDWPPLRVVTCGPSCFISAADAGGGRWLPWRRHCSALTSQVFCVF